MSELKERFLAVYKETVTREGSDSLLDWLEHSDFFVAPASTRYHGCYEGGLLQHSLNVYDCLKIGIEAAGLQGTYSEETIAIVSLMHDLCKVNYYKKGFRNVKDEETGQWYKKEVYEVDEKFPCGEHADMTAQHNKKYDAEANGMLRVETWAEVYSAITLLAEEDDLKGWKEVPMAITLYSTGCPKCKVLKKKLEEKGIKYTENNSVDEMLSLGISQVPVLSVNNKLLDFSTANDWVNQQ